MSTFTDASDTLVCKIYSYSAHITVPLFNDVTDGSWHITGQTIADAEDMIMCQQVLKQWSH